MSATMDRLAEANPNIGEHLRDWQIARTGNNEDSYDWSEFRQHEQRLGAPDPGDDEPEEFRQYDWTRYAPSSTSQGNVSSAGTDTSGSSSVGSSPSSSASDSSSSSGSGASGGQWQGHTEQPEEAKKSLWDFLRGRFGRR